MLFIYKNPISTYDNNHNFRFKFGPDMAPQFSLAYEMLSRYYATIPWSAKSDLTDTIN